MSLPKISKHYFKANCSLIAKLEHMDYLQFTRDNTAVLNTVFVLSTTSHSEQKNCICVSFYGETAELFHKKAKIGRWFCISGNLKDSSPEIENYILPRLSIKAEMVSHFPSAEEAILQVEVIGRLTDIPEKVIKPSKNNFLRGTIAVNLENSDRPMFFDFTIFSNWLIEYVVAELNKGNSIVALGSVSFYRKGQDGKLQSSLVLQKVIKIDRAIKS